MHVRHTAAAIGVLLATSGAIVAGRAARQAAVSCAELATLSLPDATITAAQEVPAGPFTPPGSSRALTVPAFCRIAAVATPSADSRIAIEVWIPAGSSWNGKLLGTGNGGFAGSIGYPAMAAGLNKGYATAGTDTGHTGDNLDFAIGHPEKVTDWSHRAIHVMTDLAKQVVKSSRGRLPDRSYFEGCSTGGQQALSEAQRYPADYDGIVAGDPGHNRVRLILGFLWAWTAMHDPDGTPILPAAKLPLITKAAVSACDASDGVQDGLISDPLTCRFDPATLACTGADGDTCLTAPQVAAVRKVYQGARNPRTGEQIFPGWARGSESGWGTYIVNPTEPVRVAFLRSLVFNDPAWDPRRFNWDSRRRYCRQPHPVVRRNLARLPGVQGAGRQVDHVYGPGRSGRASRRHDLVLRGRGEGDGRSCRDAGVLSLLSGAGDGTLQRRDGSELIRCPRRAGAVARARRRPEPAARPPPDQWHCRSHAAVVRVPHGAAARPAGQPRHGRELQLRRAEA